MFDIFLWIMFGAAAGWVADMIMESPHGLLEDIILGIIGAFIGGFIFNLFGQPGVTGFNLYSFLLAIVGAIAIIAVSRFFSHSLGPHHNHSL